MKTKIHAEKAFVHSGEVKQNHNIWPEAEKKRC